MTRRDEWTKIGRAVLIAGALGGAACSGPKDGAAGGEAPGGGRGPAMAMPVEMVTLEPAPVERFDEFVGIVKSLRLTTIQAQAEGIVTAIPVKSGDRVAPGALLAEIDSTVAKASAASLESVRAAREAEATFARQQAQRAKTLLDAGAMSQQEYDQAVAQQKAADAQLKAVEEQMRQQRAELAYYRVVAQTAGVVGDIPVRVGDRVTRGTMLTTVEDNSGLEIYINVPVQRARELRVGLPIRLVDDAGATIATHAISFVSTSADDQTQTVLVKAPIESRGGRFRTDQFVRARVVWNSEPGLTIPVVAVSRMNGQNFVYLAEPGGGGLVAKMHAVTLGPVIGQAYVVTGGLKSGDKLIVSGLQKIGDGAPVQAAPPAAKTGDGRSAGS